MEGATLKIPTASLLQRAIDGIDAIPMEDRDTKGDVYEYMLGKLSVAKVAGQFRTCLLYTSPSPRDQRGSRMPSSA